jgi:hypothetical protein
MKLYHENREAALRYLSDYSRSRALSSLETAESIVQILKTRLWKKQHREKLEPGIKAE